METSDLRSRANVSRKGAEATLRDEGKTPAFEDGKVSTRVGFFDILRILGGVFLLSSTLSYFITNESVLWGYRPAFTQPAQVLAWFVCAEVPVHFQKLPIFHWPHIRLTSTTAWPYSPY